MIFHDTRAMSHAEEVERISCAAFNAWQRLNTADSRVLLAYKHGDKGSLKDARDLIAAALATIDAALPVKRHLPEYTTTAEIGACEMQIGVDYTYEPGIPERRPTMNCPGEPGEGPVAYIGEVYWRHDDDKAPWKPAGAVLSALLIDAMGGEATLVEELCAHAEGRAEAEAHDRAEAMRDMWQEAGE